LDQTRDGTLVFGRNCYEEMIERAHQPRESVVLSRNSEFQPKYGHRAGNLLQALDIARGLGREIWICGGQDVYRETIALADRLLLTLVDIDIEGDTQFPSWEQQFPCEVYRRESFDRNYRYTFLTYEREGHAHV
jgi:dihydrofolate reductase